MATIDGFKRIASDIANLCELQMQLLSLDGKVAASRLTAAVVAFGLALVVSIAAVTAFMIAAAWALHETIQLPLSFCLMLSSVFGMLVAAVSLAIGYQSAKQASTALAESRGEFASNMRWMKSVLTSNAEPTHVHNQPAASTDHFSRSFNEGNGKPKVASSRS